MNSTKNLEDLQKLNQLLNRAGRALNCVAIELSRTQLVPYKDNLQKISSALVMVSEIQSGIYKIFPELEYHYDINRSKTEYMKKVEAQILAAKSLEGAGDKKNAIEALVKALDLEPPALTYEAIHKEIERLRI